MGAPVPMPKKGLSKGMLWGIIGGAAGLILLIIGVVLAVTVFGGPSKADYSKAGEKVTEANSAYNDMGTIVYDLTSSSSTATSRKNAQDSMNQKLETFNTAITEAGKMKGITGDKEVKAKYDAVTAKIDTFNNSVDKIIEISDKFIPAYAEIGDLSSSSTAAEIASVQTTLENIGTLKDDSTNTFVTASITYLKALAEYKAYRDAYTASGDYDSNAYTRFSAAYDTFSDAAKDWQSSIEKMSEEAELKNELNALATILDTKIYGN